VAVMVLNLGLYIASVQYAQCTSAYRSIDKFTRTCK